MPARVFDWRDDPSGTLVAVPQVRARFLEFQPGQPMGNYHSHEESDGVETFVCLTGRFRFDIDGEVAQERQVDHLRDAPRADHTDTHVAIHRLRARRRHPSPPRGGRPPALWSRAPPVGAPGSIAPVRGGPGSRVNCRQFVY